MAEPKVFVIANDPEMIADIRKWLNPRYSVTLLASNMVVLLATPLIDPVSSPSDPTPLEPAPPWWASLTLTTPKTKVWPVRNGVIVYRASNAQTPSFGTKHRELSKNQVVDIWATPIRDSEGLPARSGWLCVYDGAIDSPPQPYALFVRAEDVAEKPVP